MTNREKFEEVFQPITDKILQGCLVCPDDICKAYPDCKDCPYDDWWEQEYKEKEEKAMTRYLVGRVWNNDRIERYKKGVKRMTRKEALSKAIMTLMYFQVNFCKSKEAVENTQAVIDALEQIEKEPKWIPVSERLPEKATRVLTSWVYVPTGAKYIEVAERWGDDDDYTFYGDTDEYKMNRKDHKVIAWMPLPKPYKAESEE